MHPAGAAERGEGELARVQAALDADHPQRAHHLGVGHAHDAQRRLLRVEPERLARRRQRALGQLAPQRHLAAAQLRAVGEQPEEQVGVRHRGVLAAAVVAGGPRLGARGARADAQRPAGVGARDRAAARADRVHVDHRMADRHAGDDGIGRGLRLAADHRRHVGARAAHVEREQVVIAARRARERGAHDAAGRAREDAARGASSAAAGRSTTPPEDCMMRGTGTPASSARSASLPR